MPKMNSPETAACVTVLRAALPLMPEGMPRTLVEAAVTMLTQGHAGIAHACASEAAPPRRVPGKALSTAQLAAAIDRQPGTIRRSFAKTGGYRGLTPVKLRSGQLAWPHDAPEQLARQHHPVDVLQTTPEATS